MPTWVARILAFFLLAVAVAVVLVLGVVWWVWATAQAVKAATRWGWLP